MSRSQRAPMCGSSNNDNIIHGKNSKDRGWVWNADTHGNSFGSIDRRHRWTVYIVFFILGCLIAAPRGACSFSSEALLLRSSSGLWNNHHRRGSLTMKCGTRRHGRNRNKNFQIATTTMALGFLDRNNNNNNADLNNQKNGKMLSFDAKSGTFAFSTGSLLRLSDRQRNALPNDSQRQWRLCAEPFKSEGFFDDVEKDGQPLDDDTNLDAVLALTTATTVNQPTSLPEPRRWADNKLYRQELSVTAEEGLHLIRPPTAPIYVSSSTKQRDNVGGYDPSEGISVKNPDKLNVGDPQVKLAEKEFSVNAILKELAAIQQQGPQKYCILGTRHCSFLHQQIIELLAYALVLSGNHVYTSGASGTNAATIRGALRAESPDLLTVVIPQSLHKQTAESQELLKLVEDVVEMPQNNDLSLDIASRICNSYLLSLTDQLISFAFHESSTVIEATKEAKKLDMLVTVLFLD